MFYYATGNPFVRVLTPTPLNIFQCQIASVIFQTALNSDGLSNAVDTITLELFQNGLSINNSSRGLLELQSSLQIFQLDILATSSQDGEYYLCKFMYQTIVANIKVQVSANYSHTIRLVKYYCKCNTQTKYVAATYIYSTTSSQK